MYSMHCLPQHNNPTSQQASEQVFVYERSPITSNAKHKKMKKKKIPISWISLSDFCCCCCCSAIIGRPQRAKTTKTCRTWKVKNKNGQTGTGSGTVWTKSIKFNMYACEAMLFNDNHLSDCKHDNSLGPRSFFKPLQQCTAISRSHSHN